VVLQSYASLGEWVVFCGAFMAGAIGYGAIGNGAIGNGAIGNGAIGNGAIGMNGSSKSDRGGQELIQDRELGQALDQELGLGMLMSFAAVAGLSLSQAYAWNPLPLWLLGVLAVSPSIMAIVDMGLSRSGRVSLWRRLIGFLVLVLLNMGLVYFFVLRTEPQW
jgi:hypothetical protein